jgi:RNA polymerase-binding transcription factor DksA
MVVSDPTEDAALLDRLGAELDEVEGALGRLDTGEFGRCGVCGSPIEADFLASHPIATRCAAHRPS